jgi:putative PIN family toxin of toxin-antitoxin system
MKAVFDVAPIVSSTITALGPSGRIMDAWYADQFELITSPSILADLRRVLGYAHIHKRHQWSDTQIDAFVQFIAANATVTSGRHHVEVVTKDPTDNKILACAEEGQADYIVTSDERHLLPLGSFRGIPIVRPRQFLEILARRSAETE